MGSSVLDLCRSIFSDRVVIFESLNRPELSCGIKMLVAEMVGTLSPRSTAISAPN